MALRNLRADAAKMPRLQRDVMIDQAAARIREVGDPADWEKIPPSGNPDLDSVRLCTAFHRERYLTAPSEVHQMHHLMCMTEAQDHTARLAEQEGLAPEPASGQAEVEAG